MIITIFCNSKLISIRLAELIDETTDGVSFQNAFSYAEAMKCLAEYKADIVLMDLDFAGNNAAKLLKWIKKYSDETVVMVLFSLASEPSIKQFRDYGADYLFDKYNDFEKITPVIKTIRRKVSL